MKLLVFLAMVGAVLFTFKEPLALAINYEKEEVRVSSERAEFLASCNRSVKYLKNSCEELAVMIYGE